MQANPQVARQREERRRHEEDVKGKEEERRLEIEDRRRLEKEQHRQEDEEKRRLRAARVRPTARSYERGLREEVERYDQDVKRLLEEVTHLLPFLEGSPVKRTYFSSSSSGQVDDFHHWYVEREKDFVKRYVIVMLSADKFEYLQTGQLNPSFTAYAGSWQRPNWATILDALPLDRHEQLATCMGTDLNELRQAVVQAIRLAF
jgi:hypothetical protein